MYKKYTGKEIHIKLFKKQNDLKEFNAVIKAVNEEEQSVIVEVDNKEIEIHLKDIATAYTTYDFDSALKWNTYNVNLNKLNKFNKNN